MGEIRKEQLRHNDKNQPIETFIQNGEKRLNCEILNKSMIIEVDDDQIQRENVTRYILSDNIKFVSVCDNLYRGTK